MFKFCEVRKVYFEKELSDNELKDIADDFKRYVDYWKIEKSIADKELYKNFILYINTYKDYFEIENIECSYQYIKSNIKEFYSEVKKYM